MASPRRPSSPRPSTAGEITRRLPPSQPRASASDCDSTERRDEGPTVVVRESGHGIDLGRESREDNPVGGLAGHGLEAGRQFPGWFVFDPFLREGDPHLIAEASEEGGVALGTPAAASGRSSHA